jgi:2-dehydropantoate 2-reductase
MRIAVIGAGGVGGLLAALLARDGNEVSVVARGAQLEAIRARGLQVSSPLGDFTQRVATGADPGALAPADAVLVAVKAWQLAEVAPTLAPLLSGGGVAVPLQNGVEAADRLAAALGSERVAGGIVNVLAWIEGPGVIRHLGGVPRIVVGELGDRASAPSARLEALAAALSHAGAEAKLSTDMERVSWEKFLLIEPWGAISAVARAPLGVVRGIPETRALLVTAMEELATLARARGVRLAPDATGSALALLDGVTPEATASMQRDIGAGRPSELEDQTGAVVRLARVARLAVPVHEVLLAALLPQEAAARGRLASFPRT